MTQLIKKLLGQSIKADNTPVTESTQYNIPDEDREMMTLLDQAVLETISDEVADTLLESETEDQYITEVRAIKHKVIRDLMLTIKFGGCPDGFKVDSNTKQCVRMTTAEQKILAKLAKKNAKKFKKKGTAAAQLKKRKWAKSMVVRKRYNLKDLKAAKKN